MVKSHKCYICKRAYGKETVVRDLNSEVELHVPDLVKGLILAHTYTSFTQFLDIIPEKECFVSPIPEYHFFLGKNHLNCHDGEFRITIPHRTKKKQPAGINSGVTWRHIQTKSI